MRLGLYMETDTCRGWEAGRDGENETVGSESDGIHTTEGRGKLKETIMNELECVDAKVPEG